MADTDKVMIVIEGGPRDGEKVTLAKGHIPRVMDVLGIAEGVASGRYELRYVWQGEPKQRERVGESTPDTSTKCLECGYSNSFQHVATHYVLNHAAAKIAIDGRSE